MTYRVSADFASGEERAHWKLHIGVTMIAGALRRATILDSVCPEKEILTAIVAGLLYSHPRGVGKKPEACRWTAESQIPTTSLG